MKSSPSPPAAPDPSTTAQAQTQSNLQTAIANAELNRVSQQTPWGSINYSVTGKNPDGTPIYSSNIALSPAQQQLLEQQQGLSTGRNALAGQILQGQSGQIAAPINFGALAPIQNHGQTYQGAVNAPSTQASVRNAAPPSGPQFTGGTGFAPPTPTQSGQNPFSAAQLSQILAALGISMPPQSGGAPPASPAPGQPAPAPMNPTTPWGPNALTPEMLAKLQNQGG